MRACVRACVHLRVHACKSIRASHGTGDDGVWKASKVRLDRARARTQASAPRARCARATAAAAASARATHHQAFDRRQCTVQAGAEIASALLRRSCGSKRHCCVNVRWRDDLQLRAPAISSVIERRITHHCRDTCRAPSVLLQAVGCEAYLDSDGQLGGYLQHHVRYCLDLLVFLGCWIVLVHAYFHEAASEALSTQCSRCW
jgi:hypothetical protein